MLPSRSRGALEVILFEDSRFRGSQMFTAAEVTIGNDPGVMLMLPDATLSPCHAVLRFDRVRADVRREDDVLRVQERMVLPGRLVGENVHGRVQVVGSSSVTLQRTCLGPMRVKRSVTFNLSGVAFM